jgi:hypothetical protein
MRPDIEIIASEWRNGKDEVIFVLVQSKGGNQRAYIGTSFRKYDLIDALMQNDPEENKISTEYVASWGCRLTYEEAEPFFKHTGLINREKYQEGGDLI